MNEINDGGSAFPEPGVDVLPNGEFIHVHGRSGMTLRDYFAAKAMQAQLNALWSMETGHGWKDGEIAGAAYQIADAMIAAREVKP